MKVLFKKLLQDSFVSASFLMVFGSNFINAINYLYHVVMGRMMDPSEYGELAAVFSFIGLVSIIPFSFGLIITKFISSAKDKSEIKGLILWFSRKVVITSILMAATIGLFSFQLTKFLHIENVFTIVVGGVTYLLTLRTFLNRAVLQGLLKFKEAILSQMVETVAKLVAGVILVWLGFSVFGAMLGLLIAASVAFFVTRSFLKLHIGHDGQVSPSQKDILKFTLPVLLQSAAYSSFFSSDVILVKHFFPSHEAGIYAAVSTLGKIVLFATAPISVTMFPFISKKRSEKKSYISVLILAVLATALACASLIILYALFPHFMINTLFGSAYLDSVKYLVPFAVFISFITLAMLLINYLLSVNKTKAVVLPLAAASAQIIGIVFFHEDLDQIISISTVIAGLLLLSLIVYSIITYKKDD